MKPTSKPTFPEPLEHLVVLGYDGDGRRSHTPELPSDYHTLGKAVLALVDDYARFYAQNPNEVNHLNSFVEGLKRINPGGITYTGERSGISTKRSLADLLELLTQGYHLTQEVPDAGGQEDDFPSMIPVSESTETLSICVPVKRPFDAHTEIAYFAGDGTRIFDGREVCFWHYGDRMHVKTDAETSYHGDGFSLHRIHSPHFLPIPPSIETQVRRKLEGIYFSLANTFMTGAIPAQMIPSLETQLARLGQEEGASPSLGAEIHHLLGNCYLWCGDDARAQSHYEQALSLDPQGKRLDIGKRYLLLDDPQRAASLFGAAIIHEGVWTGIRALPHYFEALARAV